ncbi:hypothetical protein BBJ28_00017731 [Nothophytophthora sp. Chile5]|nr:hypothetical protein BBJ28_00017731 [Nothophytophthora sp. Chile5]
MPPLWGGLVAIALMDKDERHVSSGKGAQGEKADGHLPSEGIDPPVLSLRTKQTKKARRQGSLPYSTLLQRRKRDEVRALQTQARELESRHDELKHRQRDRLDQLPVSIPVSTSDGGQQQNWFAVAALRRQERRRSERINHELKAIFQKRLEIHSAFRKILAKKNVLKGTDRIVFAGICSWFLPSEGLRFEIRQWTVISGATTDPLHASVAQCCSQLQAIKSENSSVRARDFDAIQALVLRLVGDKMRRNMETQQNVLLETRSPVVHTQSAIH